MAKVKKTALGGMGGAGPSAPPQTQLAAMNNMLKGKGAMPPQVKPGMTGLGATMGGMPPPPAGPVKMQGLGQAMGGNPQMAQNLGKLAGATMGGMPPPPRPNMTGLGAAMGGAGGAPGKMGSLRDALGKAGVAARPFKKGGSASSRADGCAQRGKTKGRMI